VHMRSDDKNRGNRF